MFKDINLYLTKDSILSRITEEDLFRRYTKGFPLPITNSPFRKDKSPSFGYFKKNERWLWKDMSTGEVGDIFAYLQKELNLSDFQDVLQFLYRDLLVSVPSKFSNPIGEIRNPGKTVGNYKKGAWMQGVTKEFTNFELNVWNRWLINPIILQYYNIYSISQVWTISKRGKGEKFIYWQSTSTNPVFLFHYPKTKHVKFYRPLEKNKHSKFFGNANNERDIQGYHQCNIKLRRPRILILTKAMKECMFWRAFGFDAMAAQGEGHHFNPDFIRHLKKYCGRIISFYDNDPAGIHGAWQLRKEFDIPVFFIPKSLKAKNITDLWEINQPATYQIIKYLSEWNSFRKISESYQNLIIGELQREQ
jgi:hypothetical protein